MLTAPQFFAAKTLFPTSLDDEALLRLPLDFRERHFYVGGVDDPAVLKIFYDACGAVLNGRVNIARAREMIRERLGEVCTTHGLLSFESLNRIIDTNVSLANNWAFHVKQLRAKRAFPAQRMVRLSRTENPRDWRRVFHDALERLGTKWLPGTNVAELAALIDHPIWPRISRFGAPYPPFEFDSGMGVQALSLVQSRDMGLVPPSGAATWRRGDRARRG